MRLKSYFAGTVEAAMALAREELGPEAMLVHSKKATTETRHAGHYEVVFALPDPEPPPTPAAPPAQPKFRDVFSEERDPTLHRLSAELAALKQRIEGISSTLTVPPPFECAPASPKPASDALSPFEVSRVKEIAQRLEAIEVDPKIAFEIASEVEANEFAPGALRDAVRSRIQVDASLGVTHASKRAVALVGPPGAGKTTALVKLATRYGLTARRSLHFISTDVFRVGAAEQLRLYASILGVSFQTVETPLALAQALEEQRRKDLVFIDTPGWVRHSLPEISELAAYIANDPEIDVHLVLPMSNRSRDLDRMMDRYSIYQPAKLLFTRLDETDRYGALINQCHQSGKPVSFLSAGEQIPEDLEAAAADRIADLLLEAKTESQPQCVLVQKGH